MCDADAKTDTKTALTSRVTAWWRSLDGASPLPSADLEKLAREIYDTAGTDAGPKGAPSADLLYARMQALGVTRAGLDRMVAELMKDLERDCCCCAAKEQCASDLAAQPAAPGWMAYCANAPTLEAARRLQGRAPL